MYYSGKGSSLSLRNFPKWTPPQLDIYMTFPEFAAKVHEQQLSPSTMTGSNALYYMTISASEGLRLDFVREGLPIFDETNKFFVVDPDSQNGINCRFGMKGVVAEAHYGTSKNIIIIITASGI